MGVGEGGDAFNLVFKLAPIGEPSIGEVGIDHQVHHCQAELITAADLVGCNAAGDPSDLNTAGGQGEHDPINGGGLGFGVDEH